ncbi:DUF1852 domain-containing protein [Subtercola sp. PAMC28395]|uniref:DUF1852 domain-containing protein n=1 Tax=Subtercola sp. PAMC28395 TaxID=2846775 RepID=UPI001C0DB884|nr:DUF1852 domain-containing protein [Subtercola sp. PAMC28395]QWT22822.1 DUF1852 domain-containing protein [Subtercola sp. PAMC28395]
MTNELTFDITTTRFDEDYSPSNGSRSTTNFANLARGDDRQQNLRYTLGMIDNRFNDLAHFDNPNRDRYSVELEIVSIDLHLPSDVAHEAFPLIEILDTRIVDHRTGERVHGIVGNNFSSYVRDYDFSVLLPRHSASGSALPVPQDFGDLHGKLFRHFLDSDAYAEHFEKPPVICISVSSKETYRRTGNHHPVLGVEYHQDALSLTDHYFAKMGLQVRYFMPPGSVAPFAFYFVGDLTNDYSDLELIGTISTMEAFQKIYRPEIYNAHSPAPEIYRPKLENPDYSPVPVAYDREERSQLAITQGKLAEEHFMIPFHDVLERWAASYPPQARRVAEIQAA